MNQHQAPSVFESRLNRLIESVTAGRTEIISSRLRDLAELMPSDPARSAASRMAIFEKVSERAHDTLNQSPSPTTQIMVARALSELSVWLIDLELNQITSAQNLERALPHFAKIFESRELEHVRMENLPSDFIARLQMLTSSFYQLSPGFKAAEAETVGEIISALQSLMFQHENLGQKIPLDDFIGALFSPYSLTTPDVVLSIQETLKPKQISADFDLDKYTFTVQLHPSDFKKYDSKTQAKGHIFNLFIPLVAQGRTAALRALCAHERSTRGVASAHVESLHQGGVVPLTSWKADITKISMAYFAGQYYSNAYDIAGTTLTEQVLSARKHSIFYDLVREGTDTILQGVFGVTAEDIESLRKSSSTMIDFTTSDIEKPDITSEMIAATADWHNILQPKKKVSKSDIKRPEISASTDQSIFMLSASLDATSPHLRSVLNAINNRLDLPVPGTMALKHLLKNLVSVAADIKEPALELLLIEQIAGKTKKIIAAAPIETKSKKKPSAWADLCTLTDVSQAMKATLNAGAFAQIQSLCTRARAIMNAGMPGSIHVKNLERTISRALASKQPGLTAQQRGLLSEVRSQLSSSVV